MLHTTVTLSSDRSKLVFQTDLNTHSRSCGESRADWQRVAEIPLERLPKILDTLVNGRDGTSVIL